MRESKFQIFSGEDQSGVRQGAEHGPDVPDDPLRRDGGGGPHAERTVRGQFGEGMDQIPLSVSSHSRVVEGEQTQFSGFQIDNQPTIC